LVSRHADFFQGHVRASMLQSCFPSHLKLRRRTQLCQFSWLQADRCAFDCLFQGLLKPKRQDEAPLKAGTNRKPGILQQHGFSLAFSQHKNTNCLSICVSF
jgi:hypothetical protein